MHIGLEGVRPRTADMLDFIVVGGGIAGLATGWALQSSGHRVTVVEQSRVDILSKCRDGVYSSPTMTQILNNWGVGEAFSRISTPLTQMSFLDGRTGEELGLIAIKGELMESLPATFLCIQYGELFSMFYHLAEDAGVNLRFDCKVVSVDPWRGMVTCEDGFGLRGDVIVGADGAESTVRPFVLGPSIPAPDCDNRLAVSLAVLADRVRQDKELAKLLVAQSWTTWLADGCCLRGAPTGPGPNHDYAMVMYTSGRKRDVEEESESVKADLFEPRAQKLLNLSDPLEKFPFTHHKPFDSWVHESGKIVLIGEAAHPMIPFGAHNTSTCIEDAMTLSILFSLPATTSQTPMLLDVFEELRQPRCAAVQRYERRKHEVITIPHGPGQQTRDALLRNQRTFHLEGETDNAFLCSTYSGFVQIYGFDAREVVQDWWVKWGRSIFTRIGAESRAKDEDDVSNSVSIVVDAEVERILGPTWPIISDPTMGENEEVVREAEARRWCQL